MEAKTVNEINKQLQDKNSQLQQQLEYLDEENRLLRDFTYNVDQDSKLIHNHRFMQD